MEDMIIYQNLTAESEAFFQILTMLITIISVSAVVALVITLIGIAWLCRNESCANADGETAKAMRVASAKPRRITVGQSYLTASIRRPGSFRGEIARR